MATSYVTRRQTYDRVSRELSLLVFAIALTSLLCSRRVCASEEGLEHFPTLKEIYGGIPKNSFPVVRREARRLQSDTESTSKHAASISESLRRGLRGIPHALTVPVSDVGFTPVSPGDSAYFAQLQIGTPPQDLLLLIDTGSPYFWAQTKQCTVCYDELLPTYDHTKSSTYEPEIFNGSLVPWGISYGDGSANLGYKARETLTIDSGNGNRVVIPEFEFGVAVNNTGINIEFSGLLGLSPTYPGIALSPFLTQLETISNGTYSKFSKKFRYCFPDRVKQGTTTSFLSFGEIDEYETKSPFSSTKHPYKSKILWTALIPNGIPFPYYTVNLTAITVGGVRIPIAPQELTLESVQVNETMTIVDSGTTISVLREPYFSQFIDAYSNATINLGPTRITNGDGGSLQYNISSDVFDGALFPSVSFIFQKWRPDGAQGERDEETEVFLSKDNLLFPYQDSPSKEVVYQVNINAASDNINIIGNFAQENFLIEFDLEKNRVGFLPASCTFEY